MAAFNAFEKSYMTLGGYEKNGGEMYDAKKFNLTSHRVNGSFHWELKVNKMGWKGQ